MSSITCSPNFARVFHLSWLECRELVNKTRILPSSRAADVYSFRQSHLPGPPSLWFLSCPTYLASFISATSMKQLIDSEHSAISFSFLSLSSIFVGIATSTMGETSSYSISNRGLKKSNRVIHLLDEMQDPFGNENGAVVKHKKHDLASGNEQVRD
jgi:hypothetical protein